jgi:hypothetical protein
MPRFPGGAAVSFRLLGKAGSGVSGKRISALAEEVIAECADKGLRPLAQSTTGDTQLLGMYGM